MTPARTAFFTVAIAAALSVGGCGFRPIYAAPETGAASLNQLVAIRQVSAPPDVLPLITDALNARIILKDGQAPQYDLHVDAKESAERLAVQIDATVTRYNYRLSANYVLINHKTGQRSRGSAKAVTSYNIVSSQYSTLYAERTAQEKAARLLAEEIERDLLIRFSDEAGDAAKQDAVSNDEPHPETEIPLEPRRDAIIEPIRNE